MKTYKIAVLTGDGIGPEIVDQAIKAMKSVGEVFNHKFDLLFDQAPRDQTKTFERDFATCRACQK